MSISTAVILCGGLGTRLGALTATMPKSLVPVNGKPFLGHQLNYLIHQGISKITLCVGHLGHMIEEYIRAHPCSELEIKISHDKPGQIGTARALCNALKYLPDDFFVLYGDSYLPVNFSRVYDAYCRNDECILMTVYENNNQFGMSNVIYREGVVIDYSKVGDGRHTYIDYGLLVFPKSRVEVLIDNRMSGLSDFLAYAAKKSWISGYVETQRFYEIGTLPGLKETEEFLKYFNTRMKINEFF